MQRATVDLLFAKRAIKNTLHQTALPLVVTSQRNFGTALRATLAPQMQPVTDRILLAMTAIY